MIGYLKEVQKLVIFVVKLINAWTKNANFIVS